MDEKGKSDTAENKDVKELRQELNRRIQLFEQIENMMDVNLSEATDAGYRLGWMAGVMAAMERLEKIKMKMAAGEIQELMDEGPDKSES